MPQEDIMPEGQGTNPTDDEEVSTESTENEEDVEETTENGEQDNAVDAAKRLAELENQNAQLKNYVKKLKGKKEETRTDLKTPDVPTSENAIQEQVLKANGTPAELIEVLKTISQDKGVNLLDAQSDDYYVYKKDRYEQEQRDKEAQLGASKGSGAGKPKKTVNSTGLSEEEHKRLWKQAMK